MAKLIPNLSDSDFLRFRYKVDDADENDCWNWCGYRAIGRNGDYGNFMISGSTFKAHRIAYKIANGHVSQNLEVCHKCDNTLCVNPNHLFLGTHSQNMADCSRKGRLRVQTKPSIGESNGSSKLKESDVIEIRGLYKEGKTQKEISKKFGIDRTNVSYIVSGRTWTHLALCFIFLFLAIQDCLSTDVQFSLRDPQFGISQTTNRTVIVQAESGTSVNGSTVLLPFRLTFITDSNGVCTASNLFGSPIAGYYHLTVPAPPQRADFDIWVQQTNLGLVQASSIMGVFGASTYPAAVFAWGAQISDARYQLNGTTLSNTFYPLFSNPSNYVPNSILLSASNALASSAGVYLSTVTNIVNGQTNGLATTNYVNTATNAFATTNYVGKNYYPTSNPSLFVTASITNGLATTNYANGTTNLLTDTAYKPIYYFQPANLNLTNLSGIPSTNVLVFTNSTLFDSNGVALLIGSNLTNDVMTASNAVYKAATNAVSSQSAFNATNGILGTITNIASAMTNGILATVTNIANVSSQSSTNGYQQGITNIINSISGSGNFIGKAASSGTNASFYSTNTSTVNPNLTYDNSAVDAYASNNAAALRLISTTGGAPLQFITHFSNALWQGTNFVFTATHSGLGVAGAPTIDFVVENFSTNGVTYPLQLFTADTNKTAGLAANNAYFDKIYIGGIGYTNETVVGAGTGVSVSSSGNVYTISANSQTNLVVFQNHQATNIVSVGYLSLGGGLTFIVDTNVIGVTNCGNPLVNGTYQFYNTGSAYTNLNDNRFVIMFSNPTWFLKGTNNSLYQSTALTNAWTVVGSPATPVPTAFTGGYIDFTGFTRKTPQEFLGTNDPNGIVIAPIGSTYIQFTNGLPKVMLVNTNGLSGWY